MSEADMKVEHGRVVERGVGERGKRDGEKGE